MLSREGLAGQRMKGQSFRGIAVSERPDAGAGEGVARGGRAALGDSQDFARQRTEVLSQGRVAGVAGCHVEETVGAEGHPGPVVEGICGNTVASLVSAPKVVPLKPNRLRRLKMPPPCW